MRRSVWITAVLVLLGSGVFPAETCSQSTGKAHPAYVPVTRFDPSRDAMQDIGLAITEAQRSNRRVLLDVGGDWCIWCHRLDTLFAKHPGLATLLHEKFVVVKVNYSKENKNEKALSRLPKIPGYPHLFVLSEDGMLLHSQDTAELESGKGYDPEKVMAFVQGWGHPQGAKGAGTER